MQTDHSHLILLLGVIVFSLVAVVHEQAGDTHGRRFRLACLVVLGLLALTLVAVVVAHPQGS